MKTSLEQPRNLIKQIEQNLQFPNIWSIPSVSIYPERRIKDWWIVSILKSEVYGMEPFGFHFVGRDLTMGGGAVSSKIINFDPEKLAGITSSGRIYQLEGLPGFDADAKYVLTNWVKLNRIEVAVATNDFLQQYGIKFEFSS